MVNLAKRDWHLPAFLRVFGVRQSYPGIFQRLIGAGWSAVDFPDTGVVSQGGPHPSPADNNNRQSVLHHWCVLLWQPLHALWPLGLTSRTSGSKCKPYVGCKRHAGVLVDRRVWGRNKGSEDSMHEGHGGARLNICDKWRIPPRLDVRSMYERHQYFDWPIQPLYVVYTLGC